MKFYLEVIKKITSNNEKNAIYRNIINNHISEEEKKHLKNKLKEFLSHKSIPIIGEYKDGIMRDLITGKPLEYKTHSEELSKGLTYTDAQKISTQLVLEVLKLLNEDDIKRYSECINEIEEHSAKESNKKKSLKQK